MTFRMGTERSARFAALAPVAGHCWQPAPRPDQPRPTVVLAGADDPLCPLAGGHIVSPWDGTQIHRPPLEQTMRRWAGALGCPPEPDHQEEIDGVRTLTYPPGASGVEFTIHLIRGLGHHWPGGTAEFNPKLAGRPSKFG